MRPSKKIKTLLPKAHILFFRMKGPSSRMSHPKNTTHPSLMNMPGHSDPKGVPKRLGNLKHPLKKTSGMQVRKRYRKSVNMDPPEPLKCDYRTRRVTFFTIARDPTNGAKK